MNFKDIKVNEVARAHIIAIAINNEIDKFEREYKKHVDIVTNTFIKDTLNNIKESYENAECCYKYNFPEGEFYTLSNSLKIINNPNNRKLFHKYIPDFIADIYTFGCLDPKYIKEVMVCNCRVCGFHPNTEGCKVISNCEYRRFNETYKGKAVNNYKDLYCSGITFKFKFK